MVILVPPKSSSRLVEYHYVCQYSHKSINQLLLIIGRQFTEKTKHITKGSFIIYIYNYIKHSCDLIEEGCKRSLFIARLKCELDAT